MGDSNTGKGQGRVSIEELLAGLDIAREGRARARRELDKARKRLTWECIDAIRAQVGLPQRARESTRVGKVNRQARQQVAQA